MILPRRLLPCATREIPCTIICLFTHSPNHCQVFIFHRPHEIYLEVYFYLRYSSFTKTNCANINDNRYEFSTVSSVYVLIRDKNLYWTWWNCWFTLLFVNDMTLELHIKIIEARKVFSWKISANVRREF